MDATPAHEPYLLANAGAEASTRLTALATLFDSGTIRHLERCGIGPGWRCLEVGGGGGSIAAWLAARVGPTGHVLVTDLDIRFLLPLETAHVEVRRHDLAIDPLPEAAFDLVHVRLVLNQFREPAPILARLCAALRPGGWLVCEEFDSEAIAADPAVDPAEERLKAQIALGRLMAARGFDRRFGRRLFGQLRGHGLADVGAEGRVFLAQGGSVAADLVRANCAQLREALVDSGEVTAAEVDRDLARLSDPEVALPSSLMWAAWGRRPAAIT